jgi:GNAT superfamily N-acetyltransferase
MRSIEIFSLPPDQIQQLSPLLAASPEKPHRFLRHVIADELDTFWLEEIANILRNQVGTVFFTTHQGKISNLVVYADLPWDSNIFGRRMGALKYVVVHPDFRDQPEALEQLLDHVIQWAIAEGVEFLLCKSYTDDQTLLYALQQKGFLLVDTLLNYVYDMRRHAFDEIPEPPLNSGVILRQATEDDLESLIDVAHRAFRHHFGRYNADIRISSDQATQVYEEWIRSAIAGYADWIIVAEVNGTLAGYSVWKKPAASERSLSVKVGHYSIAAVHPDYSGRGLFGTLTYAGMALFPDIADCIEGPTHINNYPVQRGYTKLRWHIADAQHSFHKWLIN